MYNAKYNSWAHYAADLSAAKWANESHFLDFTKLTVYEPDDYANLASQWSAILYNEALAEQPRYSDSEVELAH